MNSSNGARVGVRVGTSVDVLVRVGISLGRGDLVNVGSCGVVGDTVKVTVAPGVFVHADVTLDEVWTLHATSQHAITTTHNDKLRCLLWLDGEEGVMIIDLPM